MVIVRVFSKLKQAENCLFLQINSGTILNIFNKTISLFHSIIKLYNVSLFTFVPVLLSVLLHHPNLGNPKDKMWT